MNTPVFSVIVPVYKVEAYLPECLDSILAQTFTDFELLLIEDGSPDNCGAICDEYARKDSRVRVLHKENGGVSAARNLGLDEAKGEWISFVDGDDRLSIDFLERMLQVASQEKADAVFCNCFYAYGHQNIPKIIYKENQTEDAGKILKRFLIKFGMRSEMWGKIIRRERIGFLRLKEDIKIGEDLLFLLEFYYCQNCKTAVITDFLYYYRQLSTSAMNKSNLLIHNRKLLMEYLQLAQIYPDIKEKNPREHAVFLIRVTLSCIKRDIFQQSKDIFLMNILKENFELSKVNLFRGEKRFLRILFIHPLLGFLALQIENMAVELYFNRKHN